MNLIKKEFRVFEAFRFMIMLGTLVWGVILLSACGHQPNQTNPVDYHTSQISVDWAGTYTGSLPCADCEAIHWRLTLNNDRSFILQRNYLGKLDDAIRDDGRFSWADDGQRIILITKRGESIGFFVGENRIWLLDQENRRITGGLADLYTLIKE
ncbi:hypothetical protein THIAE_02080 [Thiomicrospira aerophila AL3]|uniref:Copper resistance lipoprotein NlpE n=1 Tax=Thiomicrospira aerophila AL3 TaxID=717772 RepID=W0DTZ1_9GAMM|nr:copper resistance protein NlpE [Thiomicrospira aerophila]AHF00718.1 hypothetical protein THIAE_02080 [Thiomicrospira aerophila AL3]